jgi:tRNA threonylcarbamoyladenosine biosynthesis protein TsaE
MEITYHISQIDKVAAHLWREHKDKRIWAFYAPMGAGKTTLIKELCSRMLGCKDVVSSPTFAIVNEYHSPDEGSIFHMDWYRLEGEQEIVAAGVEETLNSGARCFIEWPERAPLLLPEDALLLQIDILPGDERRVFDKSPE